MSTTSPFRPRYNLILPKLPRAIRSTLAHSLALAFLAVPLAQAQSSPAPVPMALSTQAALELPDAPGFSSSNSDEAQDNPGQETRTDKLNPFTTTPVQPSPVARLLAKHIQPGQRADRLGVGDKVLIGLRDPVSEFEVLGWITSATWSQLINSTPNYGSGGKAYAQRLGASAARSASEGIFSDAIMAPVFHEDPRYFILGNRRGVAARVVYALTRTVITRTDSGRETANLSLLTGNLAGSALTQAYYPPVDRGFGGVMKTFGTSIGGSAVGFVITEFLGNSLDSIHFKKAD